VLVVLGIVLGTGAMWSVLVGPTALFPLAIDETGGEASRAAGPFGEPNFFALSLAIIVPLAMHLVAQGGALRLLGYASVLAVTGGVLAAGSRAALITVVVAVLAALLAGQARRARGVLVVVLAALAVLVPVFAGQAGSSAERTVSGRATENLIAVAMFAEHPLTGVGPGGYTVLYRDYARDIGNDPRELRHAHSLPLEIAAEQGVVGIAAWLVAGLVLWRLVVARGVWHVPVGRALVLCLGAYGFNSLFLHGSQMRVLMMLVGALIALAWARDLGARRPRPRLAAA
jgi:teichuronic acid biosynthesis protein TuaE